MRENLIPGTIIKIVKVNRSRTNQQVFESITHKSSLDKKIVEEMPSSEEEEMEIHFVPFRKYFYSANVLEEAVDKAGYKFVDPIALCAVYEQDQSPDADYYPNFTQWRNENGRVSYVEFVKTWIGSKTLVVAMSIARTSDLCLPADYFIGCVCK